MKKELAEQGINERMRIAIVVLQCVRQEFPACSHPRSKLEFLGYRLRATVDLPIIRACALVQRNYFGWSEIFDWHLEERSISYPSRSPFSIILSKYDWGDEARREDVGQTYEVSCQIIHVRYISLFVGQMGSKI